MKRLNLYCKPEDKEIAEEFLMAEIGHECAGTFDPIRTLNGETVNICSWDMPEAQADIIRTLYTSYIVEVDNFDGFGYLEDNS